MPFCPGEESLSRMHVSQAASVMCGVKIGSSIKRFVCIVTAWFLFSLWCVNIQVLNRLCSSILIYPPNDYGCVRVCPHASSVCVGCRASLAGPNEKPHCLSTSQCDNTDNGCNGIFKCFVNFSPGVFVPEN